MRSRLGILGFVGALGAAVLLPILVATPASARVSVTPAPWTPAVTSPNATVRQLVQCGSTMFAVGSFSTVQQGGHTYTRKNAFSFNANNGAVTTWNPNVNGEVNSIAVSANCRRAFLGGTFTFLRGRTVANLAADSTRSSAVIMRFQHNVNGLIDTVALVNDGKDLMVGGHYTEINGVKRSFLSAIGARFGVVSGYFKQTISGTLPGANNETLIYNQQVSPQGNQLLIEGDFTKIAGHHREQIAELTLTSHSARLNGWGNSTLSSAHCRKAEQFYVRSATFSPDQKTVYLATTGYRGHSPYCDAAVALTNTAPATAVWINKTGGDSLFSVAASADGVYIGGHQRWADNPDGLNSCETTCVNRPGVGEISTTSGLATSWNPTRSRGHGADDMLITRRGLWIASDTFQGAVDCGGVAHPGICFLHGAA
jgi:hypothetical protein